MIVADLNNMNKVWGYFSLLASVMNSQFADFSIFPKVIDDLLMKSQLLLDYKYNTTL